MFEGAVCEGTVCEGAVCEGVVCEGAVCQSTAKLGVPLALKVHKNKNLPKKTVVT